MLCLGSWVDQVVFDPIFLDTIITQMNANDPRQGQQEWLRRGERFHAVGADVEGLNDAASALHQVRVGRDAERPFGAHRSCLDQIDGHREVI